MTRAGVFRVASCPAVLTPWLITLLIAGIASGGCSVKKIAINKMGDALARGGTTFASDDDPELVREALPFSLKLMESLLAESPRHKGLLFATSSGFTQYAYAFVQQEADEMETHDAAEAFKMRDRARRLYLRARGYGLRGLEVTHPGLEASLRAAPKKAVAKTGIRDVPLLYWTAVSWGAAISLSKDDPDLIAEQPIMEALIDRALQLDETFEYGSIHTFLITYEMARQGVPGDPEERSRKHFQRAMELTQGLQAAPLVSLAEAVSLGKQDRKEFQSLLERALAIDVDVRPEWRLTNLVMQRRARWLLSQIDDLFLGSETGRKS